MKPGKQTERSARDRAVQALCAEVFRDPRRLVQADCVKVEKELHIPRHRHPDLMQMDLALGCGGTILCGDREVTIQSATAAVFYPNQDHRYALVARRPGAEIFSFKITVERQWPAVRGSVFPNFSIGVTGEEPLLRAMRSLRRLTAVAGEVCSAIVMLRLAEIICLWPGAADDQREVDERLVDLDPLIEAALTKIDARIANPPGLDELARELHVSPRHLSRRFRSVCGYTPHTLITARRLARAKELLGHGNLNVTQVAEALGFPTIHTFSRWFRRESGQAPLDFRQRPSLL